MKLVKDLNNSGIIYYWINHSGEKVSPDIHCFALAEEWRTQNLFATYKGKERRKSIIDRRQNHEKRKGFDRMLCASRMKPDGRRITDIPIQVEIDLVAEKIKNYY